MVDYVSETSVYPRNVEAEELNQLEKHGLQENLTQVDEQIAAITELKEESREKPAGLNHQESNTSIEKSSGYGSVDSPESSLSSQFFNTDFGIGPEQKNSTFMVAALLSNRRPQTQAEVNKKGLWDANAAERKRHSHHYGHTYNNYTTAHYAQYQQMQQQQQQHQQYYGSYDSMYINSYNHYEPRGNYASIQQFANYAALQLEQASRIKQMKRAQEVAMFQQYSNMTGLYETMEHRPASAAGARFPNYDGTMRSSSTPDRLKKPIPLEPMSKEQMAWYLKNPSDFNAAIEAAVRFDKAPEAVTNGVPANGMCFTTPPSSVPPPPGFENVDRY